MSDADNQMGGHGSSTGRDPREQDPDASDGDPGSESDEADGESESSFPASDPRSNY